MSKKVYYFCVGVIVICLSVINGVFVPKGNFIPSVIALIVGVGLIFFCKSKIKEIVQDERIKRISQAAALIAWLSYCIVGTLAASICMALGIKGNLFLLHVGITINFSILFIVFIYIIVYVLYNKKY